MLVSTLARQATARGRAIEVYAASLLEAAVHLPGGAGRLRQDRLENTFREMAQFSDKIPAQSDEAFTRESLYRDHIWRKIWDGEKRLRREDPNLLRDRKVAVARELLESIQKT